MHHPSGQIRQMADFNGLNSPVKAGDKRPQLGQLAVLSEQLKKQLKSTVTVLKSLRVATPEA